MEPAEELVLVYDGVLRWEADWMVDTITGPIRQPREGERYFALQRVEKINFADPFSEIVTEPMTDSLIIFQLTRL